MDVSDLAEAKENQQRSWGDGRYGGFIHCPLSKLSRGVMSEYQLIKSRVEELSLCCALKSGGAGMGFVEQLGDALDGVSRRSRADALALEASFPFTKDAKILQFSKAKPSLSLESKSVDADVAGSRGRTRIGIAFCGRQASGGHDVVGGLYGLESGVELVGFVGGVLGLLNGYTVDITEDMIDTYRGQGGYDMLGRTVDLMDNNSPMETGDECFRKIVTNCSKLGLSTLVLIGGSRTATNAGTN